MFDNSGPVRIPINGILDLHMFKPGDVKRLVPEYLEECRGKGIFRVRIIHGKGTGRLKKHVHEILQNLPYVTRFSPAEDAGGWGATIVFLNPETGDEL